MALVVRTTHYFVDRRAAFNYVNNKILLDSHAQVYFCVSH